jgi:hypothetical protein
MTNRQVALLASVYYVERFSPDDRVGFALVVAEKFEAWLEAGNGDKD